jgi:hypothetical protein
MQDPSGERQSKSTVPTVWSHVPELDACEAPVGGSVQEGQRGMGDKPRKFKQQSADAKPSHRVDSGGGAVPPTRALRWCSSGRS